MAAKEKKTPDPRLTAVGQRIRAVRQAKKFTMEQEAEAADSCPQYLSKEEKGEQSMTIGKFANLALALGVSSDYLLFGQEGCDEQEALLIELVRQTHPADRMLLIELFGTAGGLVNAIRPEIKQSDPH